MGYNSLHLLREILPDNSLIEIDQKSNGRDVYEIRLTTGVGAIVKRTEGTASIGRTVRREDVYGVIERVTSGSLYAYNDYVLEGYLPYKGLRIGISGEIVREKSKVIQIKEFNSLVIRLPHQVFGCADEVFDEVFDGKSVKNTLIYSPPGYGKTTFLREIARKLSNCGLGVVVFDYKNEISATSSGVRLMDVGNSCVIVNAPRAWAFECAIRNMAPEVVITDEVYSEEEFEAIKRAIKSGVKIIATMHASSIQVLPEDFDLAIELGLPIGTARITYKK